ncbi:TIGR01666 family membrane protein [Hymenobacter daecheongensis DSM 21074]|uniref:TIGR01666 family membrane protein n=1 Tax=Hymenobacter daecheongensis DSM 21074 TaxID=1121955 RepID=A0A1M6D4N0_9BACT|nr:FUSC family membrane protein [Hymenobacter daecheongensis]SHI68217.1 TIGR01666 family membrane protein [Hymenobacter daecheongensis DSM 21074]
MTDRYRQIQYFFSSQDFSDGVRITLSILLPSLLFGWLGHLETGITLSTGAVCVSVVDVPGPVEHKRNGMLYANLSVFLVALLTGFIRGNVLLMGLEVVALSFAFTMLLVYGLRASLVGTASLLIMILMMDQNLPPAQVLPYSALVLAGGLWYAAVAGLAYQVRPYRPAQQALGQCVHAIAQFLEIKAAFYRTETDLATDYRRLVAQQVVVSEKQDAVREVLFRTRQIVNESTSVGRRMVLTFVDVVDLYEHITATYYDYADLRARYAATGVLTEVAAFIHYLAVELDGIGLAIQANRPYRSHADLPGRLERLKQLIDAQAARHPEVSSLVLKKILVNLRNLTQRVRDILIYFDSQAAAPARGGATEYHQFVSHQIIDLKALRDNLTFSSSVFRHSVRMTLACLTGYIVSKFFLHGPHGYWILMTITYMLKPAFSLTKQRNYQRVLGTVVGAAIGVGVLLFLPDTRAQLALLVVLMVVAYSFQRINYIVTVIALTPYLLIVFSFLGMGYLDVVGERVLDTLIGCVIAFAAGYLLFPRWEKDQLRDFMRAVLAANGSYLQKLADSLAGTPIQPTDYRLTRKAVYVSAANLAAAFQRMLSEPKSKQRNSAQVHQFVVLNHILSSNIATITSAILANSRPTYPAEGLRAVRQALASLSRSQRRLEAPTPAGSPAPETAAPEPVLLKKANLTPDDRLLLEQLEFIQKVSSDIGKVTEAAVA